MVNIDSSQGIGNLRREIRLRGEEANLEKSRMRKVYHFQILLECSKHRVTAACPRALPFPPELRGVSDKGRVRLELELLYDLARLSISFQNRRLGVQRHCVVRVLGSGFI